MLKNSRGCRGVIDIQEKFFFIGVLIVVLLAALLWYNYIHQAPVFSPEKVFEEAFIEPVGSVTDLEGSNNLKFGFDCWIRFKSPNPMHLREASEFKRSVAEVGRRWFAEKWKDEPALRDTASSYDYWECTRHYVGKVVHEWLLINKRQHYYFYRNWGI